MAKTKPSSLDKIIAHNHAISVMLQDNEELYKNLVSEQVAVPTGDKLIEFPVGLIPRIDEYDKKYHLTEILVRDTTVKNAGYCLQACEFYRYMTERLNLYGSIKVMMYMYQYLSLTSVLESMVGVSAHKLGINKRDFAPKVRNPEYQKAVGLSAKFAEDLVKLYRERNRIHLELDKVDDISKLNFSQDNVDTLEKAFEELVKLLCQNAVPNYTE